MMIKHNLLRLLVVLAHFAAATTVYAQATSNTWDTDAPGNWTDVNNWVGNTAYAEGADNTATLGNFITADRIITLDANITIGNITASDTTHNYTISGANTLTLDRSDATKPTINVTTSSRALTLGSVIAGNDGLLKSGAGTLVFTGTSNNTFTGGFDISGGVVQYDSATSANAWGDAGNVITFTGNASLHNNNNAYTLARAIAINGGVTASLTGAFGESTNVTGVVTGSGILTVQGFSNNWALTFSNAANTFTGAINITNNSGGSSLSVASLGTSANAITLGNGSNSGSFTYTGSAALSRPFTLAGTTGAGTITSSGTGALTVPTFSVTGSGAKTLTLTGTSTALNEISGDIVNNGGNTTVTKTGAGTWILSGNNSHSGGTSATAGRLFINSATALGTGTFTLGAMTAFDNTSGVGITNSNNNAIAWNGDTTFSASNSLNLGTGAVTLGGNRVITITNAPGVLTFGGNIGGAFGITKGGGGTMAFTATNSSYTGATTVSQGTLNVNSIADYSNNSSIGAPASGNLQLGSTTLTGTLNYLGDGDSSNRTITVGSNTAGANAGGAVINSNGSGALIFTATTFNSGLASVNTARNLTLGGNSTGFVNEVQGIIQNNAAGGLVNLVKNGNSTWALGGTNSYTGTTTVNAGTLRINGNSSAAIGAVNVNNSAILGGTGIIGGAVTVNDTAFIAPGNSPGGLEVASTFNLTTTATLSVEIEGSNFTLNGLEEYDRLKVTGATTLSGLLSVSLINSWTLGANEYYGIVDAVGGRTGVFANYAEGDTVLTNSGYFLKITYNGVVADSGTPSITGGNDVVLYTVAVPEPSSLAMLAFGMITLWLFRKKKV